MFWSKNMNQTKYKTLAVAKQEFIEKHGCYNRIAHYDFEKDLTALINKAQEEKHAMPLGFYRFNWGKNDI